MNLGHVCMYTATISGGMGIHLCLDRQMFNIQLVAVAWMTKAMVN